MSTAAWCKRWTQKSAKPGIAGGATTDTNVGFRIIDAEFLFS